MEGRCLRDGGCSCRLLRAHGFGVEELVLIYLRPCLRPLLRVLLQDHIQQLSSEPAECRKASRINISSRQKAQRSALFDGYRRASLQQQQRTVGGGSTQSVARKKQNDPAVTIVGSMCRKHGLFVRRPDGRAAAKLVQRYGVVSRNACKGFLL